MIKFAANLTMMFNEVPFMDRFKLASKAGFKGVEFLFPYEFKIDKIKQELTQNNLFNALFNLPPGDWQAGERGIATLPNREEEFKQGVEQAIEYALALGTPTLHAMSGLLPPDKTNEREFRKEIYINNLRYATKKLAKINRTLVIEPINTRDIPNYFLNTQAQAHDICAEVGEPNIKVQMDLYHAQITEGDLSTKIKKYINNIAHIQIASVPLRHEPNIGEINYSELFLLLEEIGYSGWIGCEYRPRGKTEEGLNWFWNLQKNYRS